MKNRIVSLPVHTGFAHPDGRAGTWLVKFYTRLAKSGAGMVVVANVAVAEDGVVSKFNLRADRDKFLPGLSTLAKAIKKQGAIACLQLNHAGRFARTGRPLLPSPVSSSNLSFNVESLRRFMEFFPFEKRFYLTKYFFRQVKTWWQAMNTADRERVINDFADAALRSYQAGFDMVELHGANGYLLCQYLSSFTNQNIFKGSDAISNRASFPLAVLKAVKKKLPDDFPVGFRIILREWVPEGIELSEALLFAKDLEKAGAAYLSASVGTYNSIFSPDAVKTMAGKGYLEDDMKALTKEVGIPTIASGRITLPSIGERFIRNKAADLIGLGRALRADPKWLIKAIADEKKIKTCINCNRCLKNVVLEQGFVCNRWPKVLQERSHLEHMLLTRNYNTVWIITDIDDINRFKHCWSLIYPDRNQHAYPTLITLKAPKEDKPFDEACNEFIKWLRHRLDPLFFTNVPRNYTIWEDKTSWEDTLSIEILSEGYGRIFMASNPGEPWRERLLYKERKRVFSLLGDNENINRVIVPVDFSSATLLVMRFLSQGLMKKGHLEFTFVHVNADPSVQVGPQWEMFKKIADFDEKIPLEIINPVNGVVPSLVEIVHHQNFGTVIMGKRGLSGVKRWFMGSVSSGVLKQLTDQTLILID